MNSIRALAMQHIGQPCVVHSSMGVHYGVLHHVDDNGMYLQLQNRSQMVSYPEGSDDSLGLAGGQSANQVSLAWAPFFFIPWAAAFAFSPWGWWW